MTLSPPTIITSRIIAEVDHVCAHAHDKERSALSKQAWIDLRVGHWRHYEKIGSPQNIYKALQFRLRTYAGNTFGYCDPTMMDDVLQSLFLECLKSFRVMHSLPDYSPKSRAEVAEFAGYCQRYAKRKIKGRQLLGWRLIDRSKGVRLDSIDRWDEDTDEHTPINLAAPEQEINESHILINDLIDYFKHKSRPECVDYLLLKLQDRTVKEIDRELGLTPNERDCLQQKFVWQFHRFIATRGTAYHEYFDLYPSNYFGLNADQWAEITQGYDPDVVRLKLRQNVSDKSIAAFCGLTEGKVKRQWAKILLAAKEKRSELAGRNRKQYVRH